MGVSGKRRKSSSLSSHASAKHTYLLSVISPKSKHIFLLIKCSWNFRKNGCIFFCDGWCVLREWLLIWCYGQIFEVQSAMKKCHETHTPCRVFLQFWSSKAKSVCKQSVHILYCLPEVLSSTTTTWDFWLRFSTVKASNWTILPKATLDHGGWSCLMSRVKRSGCWSSCDLEVGRLVGT